MKFLTHHVLRDHVALGGLAALALLPFWGWPHSLLFWLANILIDTDHYFHFLYAQRRLPWKYKGARVMFAYHERLFGHVRKPDFLAIEIFHTAEFLLVLGFLGFGFFGWLIPVFWGCLFHAAVDWVHLGRQGILFKRANSFLEYAIRKAGMRRKGLDNTWVLGPLIATTDVEEIFSRPPKRPPE